MSTVRFAHARQHPARRLPPVIAFMLLCALGFGGALPATAFAETRGTDLICGRTADERGTPQQDLPDISAPHSIVVGADGLVCYERDADAPVKIASITKVMTAIVALEHGTVDDTVSVDRAAATVGESTAHLREGDTLSLIDALRCLMVPSGNDAALAIADSMGSKIDPTGSDPYAAFIAAMNQKAADLGCRHTRFENPHGLDFDAWAGDMHSCARDVATIVAAAMKNKIIRAIALQGSTEVSVIGADGSTRTLALTEANHLLGRDGNIGLKTGTTDEAGSCFAGAFSREGIEVYTVVLGDQTDEKRFEDSSALANWYFKHARRAAALTADALGSEGAPLIARATHTDWSDKTVELGATKAIPEITVFDLDGTVRIEKHLAEFSGDVHRGDAGGSIAVTQGGRTLATIRLAAAQDVSAPDPFEWLLVQLDRLTRLIGGRPLQAASRMLATAPRG